MFLWPLSRRSPLLCVLLIVFLVPSSVLSNAQQRQTAASLLPRNLRCDDAECPLGLDNPHPRLSWRVEVRKGRAHRQTAFQVLVASRLDSLKANRGDLWDSGKVKSSRLPYVVYGGKPLRSRRRAFWKVRVWDETGAVSPYSSDTAQSAIWEMGLLAPTDWKGQWITRDRPAPATDKELFGEDPAPLFRKEFDARKPIASARAYISGLGYYELSLNGRKVGDDVLSPAWTDYARRTLYVTYDITRQLRSGRNALGVMLGNGWYNPLPLRMWGHLNLREHLPIGPPRFLAQIEIIYEDGARQTITSDSTWKWQDSAVRKNSVYLGELYDARQERSGWDQPGFDTRGWQSVRPAAESKATLRAQSAPPIRVTRTVKPVRITAPKPGVFIVDMGRNFAGWTRLRVRGPAGTRVTLRYGELLTPDGSLNPMTSVAGQIKGQRVEPGSEAPSTAWQTDAYILKGRGEEVYTPRFTFHGFRYVELTGFPGVPTLETLTGLRLNSDVEQAGSFQCSDPTLNAIQEMTQWTELSNLFSVQSDCPHREKFGYGGDIVATSEMAMLNFTMSRFYAKTVQDYSDAVRPNGGFTETAPFVGISDAGFEGGVGPIEWGTAQPLLLWQLYQYYGNRQQIEAHYERARTWMKFLEGKATDGLLDNGIGDHEGLVRPPTALTGTAFYYGFHPLWWTGSYAAIALCCC